MDKNYLQDVVPPAQKRSIRDIPVPNRNKKNEDIKIERDYHEHDDTEDVVDPPIQNINRNNNSFDDFDRDEPKKKRKSKKMWIFLGLAILLLLIPFIVLSSLDKATIKIIPKTENSSFEERVLISELSSRNNESLGYRIIELSKQESEIAEAIDEELVQEKASGEITIYNEYSTEPQRLIRNTRFESTDGRIYRIMDSIEVPGYTGTEESKTPGQITVTVYADEVGEEYNLSSDEFTIPGFEGQDPYDFFYARTATEIRGGFDGVRKIVSESDIERVTQQLEEKLKESLIAELNNEVTDEFYVHFSDDSFTFQDIEQNPVNNSDNVQLTMRGTIAAKVFNKIDVSSFVADRLFTSYVSNEKVLIEDFDNLKIDIITESNTQEEDEETDSNETESENEYMLISGQNVKFVWQIDQTKLKRDVAGLEINSLPAIMKEYTEIKNAEATVKPFWKTKYPENQKDIKVEING